MGDGPRYSFLTTWLLRSPREPVWDAIHDEAAWPEWWRGVEVAEELRPGDELGVGTKSRMVWRSWLPYRVEFEVTATRVEPFSLMEGQAVGDLEGVGRWRLYEQDGVTAVLYEWDVATTKPWMNRMAPLLRPVFEWNHDWVMRRGGEGIAARLGCELLALD
ncbi:MAG TPA: SRPBCC family protein [Solirubrobacterales bacterium]|nr:SRPBCC family protein [Solirubrobacterales bacterium]